MCAQTRPGFLIRKMLLGKGVRSPCCNSVGKISSTRGPEEDRTRDAASSRTASPTHYQLSYSGPHYSTSDRFETIVDSYFTQKQHTDTGQPVPALTLLRQTPGRVAHDSMLVCSFFFFFFFCVCDRFFLHRTIEVVIFFIEP